MTSDLGTLEPAGAGRWRLTFTRRLPHPPERVWAAITEPEGLSAWFPSTIDGERKAGATLRFVFPGHDGPAMEGEMLVFDPPAVMELRWETDRLRFELRPDGGGTELTLIDTFDEHGKAARDAAGWHLCLESLGAWLAGEPGPADPGTAWKALFAEYGEAFGPEAASIGPPAGHEFA